VVRSNHYSLTADTGAGLLKNDVQKVLHRFYLGIQRSDLSIVVTAATSIPRGCDVKCPILPWFLRHGKPGSATRSKSCHHREAANVSRGNSKKVRNPTFAAAAGRILSGPLGVFAHIAKLIAEML